MADPVLREVREVPTQRFQAGVLAILIRALSQQSLVWAALLGAMVAWGVTMWKPEVLRISAAVGYTVLVLAPVLFRKGGTS